jgi:hypothetical protein
VERGKSTPKGFQEQPAKEEDFRIQPCMAAELFPGWEIEGLEEVAILGRNFEGPWDNECSDEQVNKALLHLLAIRWSAHLQPNGATSSIGRKQILGSGQQALESVLPQVG